MSGIGLLKFIVLRISLGLTFWRHVSFLNSRKCQDYFISFVVLFLWFLNSYWTNIELCKLILSLYFSHILHLFLSFLWEDFLEIVYNLFYYLKRIINVCLFLTERQRQSVRGREAERQRQSVRGREAERGDTESEAGSRFWAVSPELDAELKPTNHEIMTWAKVGRLTNWTTQVPQKSPLF